MVKSAIIIIILFLGISNPLFSQLSGNYTIGQGGNFSNLELGMTELYEQGISDDVTYSLLPGNYHYLTINPIPGTNDSTRFTLRSSTGDSTSVVFKKIILDQATYVSLERITVQAIANSVGIEIDRPIDNRILSCAVNSQGTAMKLDHNSNGAWTMFTIEDCTIYGGYSAIHISQNHGRTFIRNCLMTSDSGRNVLDGFSALRLNIYSSRLQGNSNVRCGNGSIYRNSVLTGHNTFGGYFDSVVNCVFHDNVYFGARYCKNNIFNGSFSTDGPKTAMQTYIDNVFYKSVSTGDDEKFTFINNTFYGDFIYAHYIRELVFENNYCYNSAFSFGYRADPISYLVQNNIFSGGYLEAYGCDYTTVRYNNFLNESFLFLCPPGEAYSNNFCTDLYALITPDKVHHNNYYPLVTNGENTSFSIDPMYDTLNPGVATNALLQGKGVNGPATDIMGRERKNPPAIGANEIMICSDSLNNSIDVPCGEEVYLNLCNLPSDGDFWWTPDSCIANPDSLYTKVLATHSHMLYLNNSLYGVVDSVYLNVIPYSVVAKGPEYINCGVTNFLTASYNPSAYYSWYPTTGLSDPTGHFTEVVMTGDTNMTYVISCEIPGCGTSYDTVLIYMIPYPYIEPYYPEQHQDTLFFDYYITCADEFLWDFGDGKTSTEEKPWHVYEADGDYTVTTTAINEAGSTTEQILVFVYWTKTNETEEENKLTIFPVPARDVINIHGLQPGIQNRITLTSMTGQPLQSIQSNSGEAVFDTGKMQPGIYLLKIDMGERVVMEKIVLTGCFPTGTR